MNILFANRYVKEVGGVEHYIRAVASRLKEKGYFTGIIHCDGSGAVPGFDRAYGISTIWNNDLDVDRKTLIKLDEILEEFSPDVIYLHAIENRKVIDYIACKMRTVIYMHGYRAVDPDGKMLLKDPLEVNTYPLSPACFARAFTRGCMPRNPVKAIRAYLRAKGLLDSTKRLEKVIVASGYMKKTLVQNGVKPENISILPYFVDYEQSSGSAKTREKDILFAGRIAEGKGMDVLLDILTLVEEDFTLNVAGTGPMEEFCRDKARHLGLADKTNFHGWIGRDKLAELYKKCSFLVLPSVWPEPFGICGIEAAFFSKPAVAFNVGGVSDWLSEGETGFLIEPYNKEKMAEKISFLLNNPEKTNELGKTAQKRAIEKYNPELHIKKLLKLFER